MIERDNLPDIPDTECHEPIQYSMRQTAALADSLTRFQNKLPYRPYCGSTREVRQFKPRDEALRERYIQINYPNINYLAIRLEHQMIEPRADVPGPTIAVLATDDTQAYLFYELHSPPPRKGKSKKTTQILREISGAYLNAYEGHSVVTTERILVSNPFWEGYELIPGNQVFGLVELAEAISINIKPEKDKLYPVPVDNTRGVYGRREFADDVDLISRNRSLRENCRKYSYGIVRTHRDVETLYSELYRYLSKLNDEVIPYYFPIKGKVTEGDLRSCAKSVSTWTWENRDSFAVDRGAMRLPSMKGTFREAEEHVKEVKRRQRLSVRRTNQIRTAKTKTALMEAADRCLEHRLDPSVENIITQSRLSRPTVYKYYNFLYDYIEGKDDTAT